MRNRPPLLLVASALLYACGAAANAQTSIIRGIHEPARVTPIKPPAPTPAEPDTTATEVAPVTVEAKRLTRPEVEKQSYRYVQGYATPTAKLDQFARWREAICIEVTAPAAVDAAKITARIKEVANTVGVKVLKPGCTANIQIIFADRPQHWVDWIAEHRRIVLGFKVSDTELTKFSRPIQAWYLTASRTNDVSSDAQLAFFGGSAVRGVSSSSETIDDPNNPSPAGCASRFTSCMQSLFKNILVFVDNGRLKGQDLGPVSDYLAMLVLSQPRSLDGCVAFASVIDLLARNCLGRASPEGLTSADVAYLKALYGADLEARKASEEVDIARRMAANLIKARIRQRADTNDR